MGLPGFIASVQESRTAKRFVEHDLPFKNPCWCGVLAFARNAYNKWMCHCVIPVWQREQSGVKDILSQTTTPLVTSTYWWKLGLPHLMCRPASDSLEVSRPTRTSQFWHHQLWLENGRCITRTSARCWCTSSTPGLIDVLSSDCSAAGKAVVTKSALYCWCKGQQECKNPFLHILRWKWWKWSLSCIYKSI